MAQVEVGRGGRSLTGTMTLTDTVDDAIRLVITPVPQRTRPLSTQVEV